MRRLLLCHVLLLAGCSFERGGVAPVDARPHDAADVATIAVDVAAPDSAADLPGPADLSAEQRETAPSDLALPDLTPPDLAPPDLALPDLALPDLALPDQQLPDTAPIPCATKYGSVNGFKLCAETATTCVFYFVGGNCNDLCGNNGGTCIKSALDSNNGCATSGDSTCSYNHGDGVCYCSR